MQYKDLLFITTLLTVVLSRIAVFLVPNVDIVLAGTIIHHFWLGCTIAAASLVTPKHRVLLRILLFGIGAGLIVDQSIFMLLGAGGDPEYWALPSSTGATAMLIAIYIFRLKITHYLIRNQKTT